MKLFFLVLILILAMAAWGGLTWIEVKSRLPKRWAITVSILSPMQFTGFTLLVVANDAFGALVGGIVGGLAALGFIFWIISLVFSPFMSPSSYRWPRSVWRGFHRNWRRFW